LFFSTKSFERFGLDCLLLPFLSFDAVVPEKKFQFGRGKNIDAVVARFIEAVENAKFKADSDEIAMAPMYIGTVPKNRNPINGIHADHFNGIRFMLVDNHVFLISCPNNPHADATLEVAGQVWTYARGVCAPNERRYWRAVVGDSSG
jgi:hypothetical protein